VKLPAPALRSIVPNVTAGVTAVLVKVTVPVGAGVVWVVPATVMLNVTLCPAAAVVGVAVRVVVVELSRAAIFAKNGIAPVPVCALE
jgi:fructose-specific phosphotransferase system IIC component